MLPPEGLKSKSPVFLLQVCSIWAPCISRLLCARILFRNTLLYTRSGRVPGSGTHIDLSLNSGSGGTLKRFSFYLDRPTTSGCNALYNSTSPLPLPHSFYQRKPICKPLGQTRLRNLPFCRLFAGRVFIVGVKLSFDSSSGVTQEHRCVILL